MVPAGYCDDRCGIRTHRSLYLDTETVRRVAQDARRDADVAIVVLSR